MWLDDLVAASGGVKWRSSMTSQFCVVAASAILLITSSLFAEELDDSGWVDIEPSALQQDHHYEWISYQDINIIERRATKTKSLNVVSMRFKATNNTDSPLYFDLDLVALDEEGEILFVMNHSPSLWNLRSGATQTFIQERYVIPGTLERVERYRVRFLGVN